MTFKELRESSSMSRKQFGEYFGIPYRTLQDWELENRKCPSYVLALIEYKLEKEGYTKTQIDATGGRHGHWVDIGYDDMDEGMWKCSVCSGERYFGEGNPEEYGINYCPNCGAKMDEKEDT